VSRGKKLLFVMQNLRFLGDNGDRGSKYMVESAIFGIATLICLFSMQLLWSYNDD